MLVAQVSIGMKLMWPRSFPADMSVFPPHCHYLSHHGGHTCGFSFVWSHSSRYSFAYMFAVLFFSIVNEGPSPSLVHSIEKGYNGRDEAKVQ